MKTRAELIKFLARLLAAVNLVQRAEYAVAEKELEALCAMISPASQCVFDLDLTASLNGEAWCMLRWSARKCVAKHGNDARGHLLWFKVMEALARLVEQDLKKLRGMENPPSNTEAAGQADTPSNSAAIGQEK